MLSVSSRFLGAVRETHTISVAARLYRPSAPTVPIDVRVLGGSLESDVDAHSRRRGTLEVAFSLTDPDTPALVRELPFGGYAVAERGIRFANGESERVQLGRFRIDAVTWLETEARATLTLSDRMAQVADEPFTTPWVPAGLKPSDAAVAAVQGVFAGTIAYHVLTTPASEPTLTSATVYDEDRASAISDLASSVSAEAFFDNLGDFVIRPRDASTIGTPAWTIDAGEEGVLIGAEESLDRSSVRNGVAVRAQGEPETAPIYALAIDSDPTSPTRWGGPFGKVALIVNLTGVSTQAQADSTAANLLNLRLGLARVMQIAGVPNPALEAGDLIEVVFADGRSEQQRINSLRLDLDVAGMIELGTKSHYRPAALLGARQTIYTGESAWRELAEAEVEEAA